jgi:hypothetical protein
VISGILVYFHQSFSVENIDKAFVHKRLFKVCHDLDLVDQALFDLVVSGLNVFIAGIPVLAIKLVEEAAVLNSQNLVSERSRSCLSCSRY